MRFQFRSSLVLFGLVVLSAIFSPLKSRGAVWETTAQWDAAAEANYREWVSQNWNKDYFVKPGPLKGLILDCADVVYSMRVVYSAAHGLPFSMKDPTTREGLVISNEMTRWDSKPEEQRLRSFIQFVGGVGSTASLPADSYPTAIKPETLGSGSLIVTDRAKTHSWTIQSFSKTGIPYLLFGSRPARTQFFERNDYPSVEFVFPNGVRPETNAGFRNFRQPADIGRPVHEVSGFSLDQYSIPAKGFMRTVQKRMQQTAETGEQRVKRLLSESCKAAKERVEIVANGVLVNQRLGAQCMDATTYDDHSTPSRDSRMKDTFKDLAESYKEASAQRSLNSNTRREADSVLSGEASAGQASATCTVEVVPGTKLTLGQIYARSVDGKFSSNPHDTLEMRWGIQTGPSAKARSCPVY